MNTPRTFTFGPHRSVVTFGSLRAVLKSIDANALLVCDSNTEKFSVTGVGARSVPDKASKVVLDAGEEHKGWESIERIITAAISSALGRDAEFFGLGGGVVCDMAAFAASVYMRGCPVVLVPTTLLAMVDASIGGKTGIDFAGYKNIIGTFYPAGRVHIAVETLATLPEREYMSGLAEVIKHALLGVEDLFVLLDKEPERFLQREAGAVETGISRSLDIKGDIVARDHNEQGVRAYLNFGHTFAHALESTAGLGVFTHGEAVAWGIDRALTVGVGAGLTDPGYAGTVRNLLHRYGYRTGPLPGGITADSVLTAMKQDKKKRGGDLRFVLQRGFGDTFVTTLDEKLVRKVLENDQLS